MKKTFIFCMVVDNHQQTRMDQFPDLGLLFEGALLPFTELAPPSPFPLQPPQRTGFPWLPVGNPSADQVPVAARRKIRKFNMDGDRTQRKHGATGEQRSRRGVRLRPTTMYMERITAMRRGENR